MRIARRPLAVSVGLAAAAALLTLATPLATAADQKATRGLRFPCLSPDGKSVVFAWRGDIWRAPTAGGTATRLTIHEAQDTKPRVSPDGKWIAFSSKRTGNYDVFVMPFDGGEPRQVTFNSGADIATDWSPDGKRLLITSSRDPSEYGLDVDEVDVAGGPARRITRDGGRDASYAPDGKTIVYARGFNTIFQDDYKGSANFDLFVTDTSGALPRRLTSTAGNEMNPCVSADGATVWYLAEWKGQYNVFSIPMAGGAEGKPVTSWTDDNARRAALAWDRKTLAFEKDGRLYSVDLTAPNAKPVAISIAVESDVRNSGYDSRTITDGAEHVSVSSDGSRIAVALRGDLWILSSAGGEAERVTSGPETDDWPRFSPEGKRLLFHSDAKGNDDVYVLDLQTKETKPLTTNAADDSFASWAPDGKRIVYTSQRTGNKDLFILDLETGEERQLTRDTKDDDDAVFSPDGSSVAFDSGRGGTQAIWVMPAGGNDSQARRVTTGSGFFQVPSFSPDGQMLAFEEMEPTNGSAQGVWAVKTSGGPTIQLSRDGSAAAWSPRGDWIYFSAERDGGKNIYRVRAPSTIEAGERVPFLGKIQVDRRREFGDLFDEAWHKLKDGFYDSNMHGIDWNALREKYRPLAVDAEIKDEFYNVVSQMLGELNASHLGIFGTADEDDAAPQGPATGYLGLELDPVAKDGGRAVTFVQPKGPADDAGLRVGDVVKSVSGTSMKSDTDLDRVLAGTAGKEVSVAFAKNDGSGERSVKVKATTENALNGLRHGLWVETSKKSVEEKTKGEAGYIHLSQMDPSNLSKFNVALAEMNQNRRVKGLVLDVRNNGGGNIHQQLLAALSAKPFIAFQPRGANRQVQPQLHWSKPVVLLINERSFSDAEVFPYGFKQLKLGKVVGMPTAGGVIGTNDIVLSDGSKFRVPRVGWYGLNGENLEHLGVKPDVIVEETPDDRRGGRDPQLTKAIEILLAEIHPPAAAPPAKPEEKPVAEPPKVEASKPAEKPAEAATKASETQKPAAATPEAPKPPEGTKPAEAAPEAPKPSEKPDAPKPDAPKPETPKPETPDSTGGHETTSTSAAAATELINPLFDAKVGEWVKTRLLAPNGVERIVVTSVTEVTDTDVEVTTTFEPDASGALPARAVPPQRELKSKDLSFRGDREGEDKHQTITLGNGKTIDCVVVTVKTRRGALEKRYYSNAVPVRGVARVERDGKTTSEAIDWGQKSGGDEGHAK